MQPRMPSLAMLTSLLLFAAGDSAVAEIIAPDCSLSWEWTFNSLNQNACTVAAYMAGTCSDGVFSIPALPPGKVYAVSNGVANCECNMVVYNLFSACSACQGGNLTTWSNYSYNCIPPLTFPHTVPSGTSVPQWALVDNTFEGTWDPTTASTVGADPEMQPGSLIGIPDSESGSPTPSTSSGSGANTAAIAGGVVGGVAALAAIGALLFYFLPVWKRRHSQAPSVATAGDDGETPPMSQEHLPLPGDKTYVSKKPMAPMRLYDPNDPTTFPKYQRVSTSAQDMHDPFAPKDGGSNGNRLSKVQAAPTPGYHGLPIV
ncbi:hypothetical protein EDB86DRAFT_3239999 [Lactarius hatsudake]|nr:hypothetical protein EDB86DRAFT_3239999 [Lactarius hatsudake]